MNKGRAYHPATVLLDGRVLVVGGYLPGNVAELFDPATDTWRAMPGRGVGFPDWHAATRLDDGRVLVTARMRPRVMTPPRSRGRANQMVEHGASRRGADG